MTDQQKCGALVFFGKGNCVSCHAVAGKSNEMFSDFDVHNAGIPQIAPAGFGMANPNTPYVNFPCNFNFSGPGENEDFGMEELSGLRIDRYKFRTSPLRNIAVQPAFFHNGSFTKLDRALRYHLNTVAMANSYSATAERLDADLRVRKGPIAPVLKRLDPLIIAMGKNPLTTTEFNDLLVFVRDGLLDSRILPATLCSQVPSSVPSGIKQQVFQGC